MKNFFVILGGMGTLATTNFLNDMNKIYRPNKDQEYLNYLVFNHASIPDRTSYILDKNNENPLEYLKEDILQAEKMNPDFFVMTCNTAHYFYNELSKTTKVPFINIIELVKEELLKLDKNSKIGLFATEGTIRSGLFKKPVLESGLEILENSKNLQKRINEILYDDVKARGIVDIEKYHKVLETFIEDGASHIILGCTEVSYINSLDTNRTYPIIDSEKLLVNKTIKEALKLRNSGEIDV